MTTTAAATPLICVWAPARALAAVFDREPPTPIPPKRPEARSEAPCATNSWLSVSGSTAPLGAKVRTAARPSAMPTAAMARPPARMPLQSETSTIGTDGIGMPVGTSPTTRTPLAARSSWCDTTMPPTSTMSDHGTRGCQARAAEEHRERGEADDQGEAVEAAEVAHQQGDPLEDAAGGGGQTGQGGDLADDDEHDQARHEPGDDRLAEELRHPAEAEQADGGEHEACRDREHRGQLHRELGVAAAQGAHDRAGEHRHGGDRPDEEQPRGAEQRVGEQGRRQGVEADLHRHPGDDGVAE